MVKEFKYKKYSKWRMIDIIRKIPIIFVETSLGDSYVIRKKDIADFIILETERTVHHIEMKFYMPEIDEPVISTFGWFLNTINPLLREEIIHRLALLQTRKKKPKKVKIFNNYIFNNMSKLEMGIENGQVKNFDKFYGKYIKAQNIYNIKTKGE